ncbi:hypothetical protein L596_009025 [Steinernema carpocapsae]|uniref:Uncharacterized protein n=1 Tax=Steinernema carpocapsae TaxID=34508 RepID=A0A4U5PE83_STECR|nr:hypothetical protein L596_009025 [Steinernema carpocapsae]
MRSRCERGTFDGQGDRGDVPNPLQEGVAEVFGGHIQNGRRVEGRGRKPAGRRRENGFRGADLVAFLDKVDLLQDFNSSTGNLGGNVKSLGERRLLGIHSCVLGRNLNVTRSDSAGLRRSTLETIG